MSKIQYSGARLALLLAASAGLLACSNMQVAERKLVNALTPYKMDIVQGNFVSKEQAEAIRPGMSRMQVRTILGSPLVTSIFHTDRWEYVFSFKRQGQAVQERTLSVFFKDDVLDHITADDLPSEAEFATSLDSESASRKVPVLEMPSESVSPQAAAPIAAAAPTAELPPLPTQYPPLEPSAQ